MATYINNIFNFGRSLPSPFDTIANKKIKVSSKYGDGTTSTLCGTVIKAVHAVCHCMDGSGEGAVGIIDHRTAAEYKSSAGADAYHLVVYDTVSPGKDCFVATAKVYPSYKDGAECYLAEATASRGYLADKPSVSPREWAQTAAVGIALRNAGFGLQFAMAGDEFEDTATDELNGNSAQAGGSTPPKNPAVTPEPETEEEYTVEPTAPPQRELTFEEKVEQAMRVPCPITKYGGKTLGDVLQMDPKAIQWCATKFTGSEEIRNAAKLICEYAQQKASA